MDKIEIDKLNAIRQIQESYSNEDKTCEIKISVPKISNEKEFCNVKPIVDVHLNHVNALEVAMLVVSIDQAKKELLKYLGVKEAYNKIADSFKYLRIDDEKK